MFPKLQQKDASTFLTAIWKKDPFKAKWTIIAKAYSIIRDAVGKHRAPLVAYLALVCPRIGVINAEDYLSMMNWNLESTTEGPRVLKQDTAPDFSCFAKHILYSTMTPKDIIHFCAQEGYIPSKTATDLAAEVPIHHQSLLCSNPTFPKSTSGAKEGIYHSQPSKFPFAETNSETSQLLGMESEPIYQWTGSMYDLYNPLGNSTEQDTILGESIDLESAFRDYELNLWDVPSSYLVQSSHQSQRHRMYRDALICQ